MQEVPVPHVRGALTGGQEHHAEEIEVQGDAACRGQISRGLHKGRLDRDFGVFLFSWLSLGKLL